MATTKKTTTKTTTKKQTTKTPVNKGGRPRIELDKDLFEKLCGIQCTEEEIAGVMDCSPDTIERWCKRTYNAGFAEIYKSKSATGKISLRRHQFKLAEKNATMAIWLGKQYLGQRDTIEIEDSESLAKLDEILKGLADHAGIESETE